MRINLAPVGALFLLALLLAAPALAEDAQQLEGTWAELGKPYQLDTSNPVQFTLESAILTVAPQPVGDNSVNCAATEKILRLNFTVQNASSSRDRRANHTMFKFTVVDAKNVNHEDSPLWGVQENNTSLDIQLKPAQKVAAFACIVTDANGQIPKLIVEPQNGPVLRYDLKGKVKTLPAPIADPADTTGTTALAEVPGLWNTPYPLSNFELTVTGFSASNTIGNRTAAAGKTFLKVHFSIKNLTPRPERLGQARIDGILRTVGGRKIPKHAALFFQGSDDVASEMLQPGDTGKYWVAFEVSPADREGAKIGLLQSPDGRTFLFDEVPPLPVTP